MKPHIIQLKKTGPCCGMVITWREPLVLEVWKHAPDQWDLTHEVRLRDFPSVEGSGRTLKEAIQYFSSTVCVMSYDKPDDWVESMKPALEFLNKQALSAIWTPPEGMLINHEYAISRGVNEILLTFGPLDVETCARS